MPVRKLWRHAPVALLGLLCLLGTAFGQNDEAIEARMRKDITFLASDECEGRGVTTRGINLAADYLAAEFKKAGLKPAGEDGSYFLPFQWAGAVLLEPPPLSLRGPEGQKIEPTAGRHPDRGHRRAHDPGAARRGWRWKRGRSLT